MAAAGDTARERIVAFLAEVARAEGLDPARLKLEWDEQREIIARGIDRLALREMFHVLTIYLEKSWSILTFSESAVRRSLHNPILFHLAYRQSILDALRTLKRHDRTQRPGNPAREIESPVAVESHPGQKEAGRPG